jgi:NAD(P)-dependent dehydrogenase (short-subunit alcohol dehydrogenase family)
MCSEGVAVMDLGLGDRVAVVTGGGAGIGLATSLLLRGEGVRVVVGDLDVSALKDAKNVTRVELDMLEVDAPGRLVSAAIDAHGCVDILVNNVGGALAAGSFLDSDEQSWRWHIDLNLMSAVRCAQAALPFMLAAGRGVVINVASTGGHAPNPQLAEYSVTKAALIAFSKLLAKEFGSAGIRSNVVTPGPTATATFMATIEGTLAPAWGLSTEAAIARLVADRKIATARIGEPADVASAIAFLACDLASQITGAELVIDGGSLPTT